MSIPFGAPAKWVALATSLALASALPAYAQDAPVVAPGAAATPMPDGESTPGLAEQAVAGEVADDAEDAPAGRIDPTTGVVDLTIPEEMIQQPEGGQVLTPVEWTAPEGDAGELALQSRLAASSLLLDADYAGDNLVAVGEWGHIVMSPDGGKTWTQAERVETNVTLTSVSFADPQNGIAVGHESVILRTKDGGKTWVKQYDEPEAEAPFFDVHYDDANNAIAVGSYGIVFETTNGGDQWMRREMPQYDFMALHNNELIRDGDNWFMPAEAGKVFVSRDGGKFWDIISTEYTGSFWGGMTISDGSWLMFGLRGNIWRSEDKGVTWTNVPNPSTSSLQDGIELKDGRILLVGLEGSIQISTDGGKTFTYTVLPARTNMAKVMQLSDGTLLAFGDKGVAKLDLDSAS